MMKLQEELKPWIGFADGRLQGGRRPRRSLRSVLRRLLLPGRMGRLLPFAATAWLALVAPVLSGATLSVEVRPARQGQLTGEIYVAAVSLAAPPREPAAELATAAGRAPFPLTLEVPPGTYRVLCASSAGGHTSSGPVEVGEGGVSITCTLPELSQRSIQVWAAPGLPVEGAEVTPLTLFGDHRPWRWPEEGERILRSCYGGITGADGIARLRGVTGSTQAYAVVADGFALEVTPELVFTESTEAPQEITLRPGGTVDVELELPPSWRGDPPDLMLRPFRGAGWQGTELPGPPRLWVRAVDPSGHALWDGVVPEGLYTLLGRREGSDLPDTLAVISAEAPGYRSVTVRLADVEVHGALKGLEGALTAPSGLTAESGAELLEGTVTPGEEPGAPPTYRFRAHFAGPYLLSLDSGSEAWPPLGVVQVPSSGEGELRADLEVPSSELEVMVSGPDGAPVAGAEVVPRPAAGILPMWASLLHGVTGPGGRARFAAMPDEELVVVARSEEIGCGEARVAAGDGLRRAQIELAPCAAVEGQVAWDGRSRGAWRVLLVPEAAPALLISAAVEEGGRFRIPHVPAGASVLAAVGEGAGSPRAVEWIEVGRAAVEVSLAPAATGAAILVPPSLDDGSWARFLLEDRPLPWRLLRRLATALPPLPGGTGFLLGAPSGRWRVEWLDASGAVTARSRPFRIQQGQQETVELELAR